MRGPRSVNLSLRGLVLMLLTAGMLPSGGCSPAPDRSRWDRVKADIRKRYPGVPQLRTDELAAHLRTGERMLLIDVREPEEFALSRIPGAINIPGGRDLLSQIPPLPDLPPIVLYCSVGYRSSEAARRLQRAGVREVANLEGSIFQWANEGRPLEGPDGSVARRVHPFDDDWGGLLKESVRGER